MNSKNLCEWFWIDAGIELGFMNVHELFCEFCDFDSNCQERE